LRDNSGWIASWRPAPDDRVLGQIDHAIPPSPSLAVIV